MLDANGESAMDLEPPTGPTRPLAGHGGQRGWNDLAILLLRMRQWEADDNHQLRPLAHPAAQSWLGGLGATQ